MSVSVEVSQDHADRDGVRCGGWWGQNTHEIITDRASAARRGRVAVVLLVYCWRVQESVAGGRGAYCIPAEICEFLLVGQSAVLIRARVGGGGGDIPC